MTLNYMHKNPGTSELGTLETLEPWNSGNQEPLETCNLWNPRALDPKNPGSSGTCGALETCGTSGILETSGTHGTTETSGTQEPLNLWNPGVWNMWNPGTSGTMKPFEPWNIWIPGTRETSGTREPLEPWNLWNPEPWNL